MSDSLSAVLKRCLNMIEASTLGDHLFDGEVHISTLNGGVVAVIDDATFTRASEGEDSDPTSEAEEEPQQTATPDPIQPTNKRKRTSEKKGGRPESWGLCPVCWDSPSEMRRADKHMMAAKCGHLLCSRCMQAVLATQRRCPQCRKYIKMATLRNIYC